MLQDEKIYPNPRLFSPERWISEGKNGLSVPPEKIAFGFGRR